MRTAIMQYGLMTRIKDIFRLGTKPPKVEALVPLKLYRSIHELPLSIFIECLCDQDYTGLIISGHASHDEIKEVWSDILQQYAELIGGREVANKLNNIKQIQQLQAKLQIAESVLSAIEAMPSQEVFDMLYMFHYPIPKLNYSVENVMKVVRVFVGHFKLEKTRLAITNHNNIDVKESDVNKKISRNYFTDALISVSIAFQMPPIQEDKITTAQYCNYIQKYHAHCEMLAKQAERK